MENPELCEKFVLGIMEEEEEDDQLLMSQFILQTSAIMLYLRERETQMQKGRKRTREGPLSATLDKIVDAAKQLVERNHN
jgi:hypothetical protein